MNNVQKAKLNEFGGQGARPDSNPYSTAADMKLMGANDGRSSSKSTNVIITRKQLQISEKPLAEGRFAVIKKAVLLRGNEKNDVVVKALRSGYSNDDVDIMNKKIQFVSQIPNHVNLVNYLGTYHDEAPGSAPAMVLDYCEVLLTDWLAAIKTVTPDTLDSMLTFSLNIARGVEHLHTCHIVHRRLSAKNVLLVKTVNGTIAKLIGYGPSKDDGDQSQPSGGQPVVKIKWLAPETISSLKAVHPVYDEKTDAWTFAVTMWETYSQGEVPYSNVKGADLLKHLNNGNQLPLPKNLPEELYHSVMKPCWTLVSKQRPSFAQIGQTLQKFRSGEDMQRAGQGYYGTDDLPDQQPDLPEGYYTQESLNAGRKGGACGPGNPQQVLYDDTR